MKRTRGKANNKRKRIRDNTTGKSYKPFYPVSTAINFESVSREEQRVALEQINNVADIYALSFKYVILQPTKHPELLAIAESMLPMEELQIEYQELIDAYLQKKMGIAEKTFIKSLHKYSPELVIKIITCMLCGISQTAVCLHVGVFQGDIIHWKSKYPVFNQCMQMGYNLYEAWWDQLGRNNLTGGSLDNTNYIFQMINRFRGKWTRDSSTNIKTEVNFDNRKAMVINNTLKVEKTKEELKKLDYKELEILEKITDTAFQEVEVEREEKIV